VREIQEDGDRVKERTRTYEGETNKKKNGTKEKMRARQLFSDVNEITRKLTRAMRTQWPSKTFPAFIVAVSFHSSLFLPVSVSTPLSPGFTAP